jgi:NAD+ synthase
VQLERVNFHIVRWLDEYCEKANAKGFVVGISGGVDSALVAHLCAQTGKTVLLLNMPIRQNQQEYERASKQIRALKNHFDNVISEEVNLTTGFETLEKTYNSSVSNNSLVMANTRSRMRMLTLYAYGQTYGLLVAGTGNKIEDFGIGFFTKYGDGGVDISPIADLTKSEVYELAEEVGVLKSILKAKPTDGLWDSTDRNDEDQIGASYPELEWAMAFDGNEETLTERQTVVLAIYRRLHKQNEHKFNPIPVCVIPEHLKE